MPVKLHFSNHAPPSSHHSWHLRLWSLKFLPVHKTHIRHHFYISFTGAEPLSVSLWPANFAETHLLIFHHRGQIRNLAPVSSSLAFCTWMHATSFKGLIIFISSSLLWRHSSLTQIFLLYCLWLSFFPSSPASFSSPNLSLWSFRPAIPWPFICFLPLTFSYMSLSYLSPSFH